MGSIPHLNVSCDSEDESVEVATKLAKILRPHWQGVKIKILHLDVFSLLGPLNMDISHLNASCNSEDESVEVATKLANIIRPHWKGVKIKNLSAGFVNLCLQVSNGNQDNGGDSFVLRTLSDQFQAKIEVFHKVLKFITEENLGVKVLCTFDNGVCLHKVEGECLTWQTKYRVKDPTIRKKVAHHFAHHHARGLYDRARKAGIPEVLAVLWGPDTVEKTYYPQVQGPNVPDMYRRTLPRPEVVREEEKLLMGLMERLGCEKAFCHMEANASNMILTEAAEDGVVLVDHDYTCISYTIYDMAWFFACFTDPSRADLLHDWPDEDFITDFLTDYLARRAALDAQQTLPIQIWKGQLKIARLLMLLRWMVGTPSLCDRIPNRYDEGLFNTALSGWRAYKELRDETLRAEGADFTAITE